MKKVLTCVAMALLLVGCAKEYNDSAIKEEIAALKAHVTALESNIDAIQSAIGNGVFVAKVQEYVDPESGKVIGVTVTYTNGDVKHFEITPKTDYTGPVLGVITNGAGEIVWAIDGVAIKDAQGNEIPVSKTPVFSIDDDGNLWVEVDGQKTNLGAVTTGGATLEDGIFTDIKVEADKIVLTLSDNSKVNIPFAEAFKLNIATTEYTFSTLAAIEIPYTVSAKIAGTVVGVAGYSPMEFSVAVEESKIVVTPLRKDASAVLLAYADSKVGLTSIVNITVEAEGIEVTDVPFSADVDYMAEGEDGSVEAHIVSNITPDVKPVDEWIHVVSVKAKAYTITLSLDNNTTGDVRTGKVNIFKSGTETLVQTITIAQAAYVPGVGPADLSKKGSANCYIVSAAGDYKFATVQGNSAENVGTVASAELLWETCNTADAPAANSVIASVSYADGYITFSTPATLVPGNALIAAKDADGNILWSWHIWIPATDILILDGEALVGAKIMDRNLGALTAMSMTADPDPLSIGLNYQWGRKDPFPGNVSFTSNTAAAVAGTAWSSKGEHITTAYSIAHPTEYAHIPSVDAGVWNVDDPQNLWNGAENAKTIYDPCPAGYRVPLYDSSLPMWKGAFDENWTVDAANYRFAYGDITFPVGGYIDCWSPGHEKTGLRTHIWASKWYDAERATCLYYREGAFYAQKFHKAKAGSVRCVAE